MRAMPVSNEVHEVAAEADSQPLIETKVEDGGEDDQRGQGEEK